LSTYNIIEKNQDEPITNLSPTIPVIKIIGPDKNEITNGIPTKLTSIKFKSENIE